MNWKALFTANEMSRLMRVRYCRAPIVLRYTWFKIAVSVTNSDGPETYRSRCIDRVSADTQNKMIKIFKIFKILYKLLEK